MVIIIECLLHCHVKMQTVVYFHVNNEHITTCMCAVTVSETHECMSVFPAQNTSTDG